jgi:hypothetical protein
MTEEEMKAETRTRAALLNQLNQLGMRPLPNTEPAILQWFQSKGVTASGEAGYLTLVQSDGNAAVPSSACETLRKERPDLFASDARRDKISSRQDLERGTNAEIYKAKSDYVKANGLEAWERLPRTKAEAERKSAPVSLDMTRAEYLALSFAEKARLAGVLGADGISKIMARKG